MGYFAKRREEKARAARQARLEGFRQLLRAERLRSALPELLAARDEALAELGSLHGDTWQLWLWYAHALAQEGRAEEAVKEYRALADTSGRDHVGRVNRLIALSSAAAQLTYLDRFAEAEAEARKALADVESLSVRYQTLPRLSALNTLARSLVGLQRGAEAELAVREALALAAADRNLPAEHFQRTLKVNLASALSAQNRFDEALKAADEAAAIVGKTAQHEDASAIAMARATALLGLNRYDDAAQAAKSGLEHAHLALSPQHARCRRLQELLARAEADRA